MLARVPLVVLAVVGLVAAPYASAQIKAFAGGGLGFNTIAADNVFVDPPNPNDKFTGGKSNLTGQAEGGVRFDLGGNLVFGVGLYVNPFKLKADESDDGQGSTTKTEVKSLVGLFGELGVKLGSATVAYGRLSFNQGKVELKFTDSGPPPVSGSVSENFTGMGLGAGVQHTLARNMYLFVDWHHIRGSEESLTAPASVFGAGVTVKVTPTLTTGLVGVGWTFP